MNSQVILYSGAAKASEEVKAFFTPLTEQIFTIKSIVTFFSFYCMEVMLFNKEKFPGVLKGKCLVS